MSVRKLDPLIAVGTGLIILGSILAGVNFVFVNLPQLFVIVGFYLILPGLLILYGKDLRTFRNLSKEEKKE